jgi:hypothetical protein
LASSTLFRNPFVCFHTGTKQNLSNERLSISFRISPWVPCKGENWMKQGQQKVVVSFTFPLSYRPTLAESKYLNKSRVVTCGPYGISALTAVICVIVCLDWPLFLFHQVCFHLWEFLACQQQFETSKWLFFLGVLQDLLRSRRYRPRLRRVIVKKYFQKAVLGVGWCLDHKHQTPSRDILTISFRIDFHHG